MQHQSVYLRVMRELIVLIVLATWLLAACSAAPAAAPSTAAVSEEATSTRTPTVRPTDRPTSAPTAASPTANTATPTAAAVPDGVVNNGGNLRKEPEVRAGNVIGQVCPQDTLTLLDQRGGWYQVRVETTPQSCDPARVAAGTTGWLNASLITLASAAPVPPANPTVPPATKAPALASTAASTKIPTLAPTKAATLVPTHAPTAAPPTANPTIASTNCDPSYPDVCIPPPPPDLNCGDITYRRFRVVGSDPHNFDGDHDGIGCEGG
ncbi:MAG: SH3 domain-containing protein [Oscillochloris sp.]|nr:SH3 domain-containing protein [Oscillochloris sp.]